MEDGKNRMHYTLASHVTAMHFQPIISTMTPGNLFEITILLDKQLLKNIRVHEEESVGSLG